MLFNILLHPRAGVTIPSYELAGQVVRHGTGWRVNRLYTIATFSHPSAKRAQVVGPNDFAAPASSPSPATQHARLSRWYAIPLFLIFGGAVLLFPLSFGRSRSCVAADSSARPPSVGGCRLQSIHG